MLYVGVFLTYIDGCASNVKVFADDDVAIYLEFDDDPTALRVLLNSFDIMCIWAENASCK